MVGAWWIVIGSLFLLFGLVQIALLVIVYRSQKNQGSLHAFLSRPWLEVGKWAIRLEDAESLHGELDAQSEEQTKNNVAAPKTVSMGLSFEILNRAIYPLAVDSIVILVGRPKHFDWQWTEFQDCTTLLLKPHSANSENYEVCKLTLDLEDDEMLR